MTEWLKIADASNSNAVDLVSGRFKVARGGWVPKGAGPTMKPRPRPWGGSADFINYGRVTETIDLIAEGTNAQLITGLHDIDVNLEEARRFFVDPMAYYSYWLEYEIDSETARKRVLLYNGKVQLVSKPGDQGGFLDGKAFARLALERHPAWEKTSRDTFTRSSLNCFGGAWGLTGYAADTGSLPGRIHKLDLYGDASGSGPIYRWWIGIRGEDTGITDFESKWQCEDGDASMDADTTAGATTMVTTFSADASFKQRFEISLYDAMGAGNYHHNVGRYLVLARVKHGTTGMTTGIEMRYGMGNDETFVANERVYHSENSSSIWRLIPLGEIKVPPEGWKYSTANLTSSIRQFEIQIWAERLEGSGSLSFDAFVMIPSEHMVTLDKCYTAAGTDNNRSFEIYTLEDDEHYCRIEESNIPACLPEVSYTDWYMPISPGVMVIAGEQDTGGSVTTDTIDLSMWHYSRFRHFADT